MSKSPNFAVHTWLTSGINCKGVISSMAKVESFKSWDMTLHGI